MRRVITATYKGPDNLGYTPGKFYPLLVQSEPGWLHRKLKGWSRDHKVIITLPDYTPYSDWETFWGHWEKRA